MNEHFFIRLRRHWPWQEVSVDEARSYFLSTCAFVGIKDDRHADRSVAFARTTGASARVVVNFYTGEELDPTPDMSYNFRVENNNWDTVLALAREEIERHPHRPYRENRDMALSAEELALADLRLLYP